MDNTTVRDSQIKRLQALKAEPDNAEGWVMLARSYTALGRYSDAVQAFLRIEGNLACKKRSCNGLLSDITD